MKRSEGERGRLGGGERAEENCKGEVENASKDNKEVLDLQVSLPLILVHRTAGREDRHMHTETKCCDIQNR